MQATRELLPVVSDSAALRGGDSTGSSATSPALRSLGAGARFCCSVQVGGFILFSLPLDVSFDVILSGTLIASGWSVLLALARQALDSRVETLKVGS
jgi:hypothetical protein